MPSPSSPAPAATKGAARCTSARTQLAAFLIGLIPWHSSNGNAVERPCVPLFLCSMFDLKQRAVSRRSLVATMAGLPAGIPVSSKLIDRELWAPPAGLRARRAPMKLETDRAAHRQRRASIRKPSDRDSRSLSTTRLEKLKRIFPSKNIDGERNTSRQKKTGTRPQARSWDLRGFDKI